MKGQKSALIIIDVQIGMLQKGVFKCETLVNNINQLLNHFHTDENTVFLFRHTNDSFLQKDSKDWQLYDELAISNTDRILDKSHSSIFKEKIFVNQLKDLGIETLTITGLVSNGCVQTACHDAQKSGYSPTLIRDAHSTYQKNAEQVIADWNQTLESQGIVVITTEEYLQII